MTDPNVIQFSPWVFYLILWIVASAGVAFGFILCGMFALNAKGERDSFEEVKKQGDINRQTTRSSDTYCR